MDWERYKVLCDSPPVCSRWLLEQTRELIQDQALAAALQSVLAGDPVPKPVDHRGGPASDMFVTRFTRGQARALADAVERAQQRGRTTSATAQRGLGGFVEAWRELERFLESRERQTCSAKS